MIRLTGHVFKSKTNQKKHNFILTLFSYFSPLVDRENIFHYEIIKNIWYNVESNHGKMSNPRKYDTIIVQYGTLRHFAYPIFFSARRSRHEVRHSRRHVLAHTAAHVVHQFGQARLQKWGGGAL